jgi:pSer/pThr/pTyr-binding forkhead associated (FHA) protein
VSRRHARILRNNGEVHIEDLGSYNGIRVNNARIAERVSLRVSDQVQIGDYKLYLKAEGHEQADDALTRPIERVETQAAPAEPVAPPVPPIVPAPLPVHQAPPAPQLVGNPNHTLVAVSDPDPVPRTIGPATAEAVAARLAPGGYGKLVVLSSNFAGKEFELSRSQMIIGRTDENDIVINHRSISRNHAKLVREPETGRYTISDLQSSNGVRVNGQDYGKVELRRGDVIDLGHVRLRFVEAGEDFVFARDAVVTDVPESGGRRGMVVALLAAIVVVVAGIVVYTMRDRDKPGDKPGNEVVVPDRGSNSELAIDAGDGSSATGPAIATNDHPGPDIVVDAAPATNPVAKSDDEKAQKAKRCTELQASKNWQDLMDCAKALEALGDKDKAASFKTKAVTEQANELHAKDVQQRLREHNLKEADALLTQIGDGSVYYKSLHDQFLKEENSAVEEARRRAQSFANGHDCSALKRYVTQLSASTERVVASAQAIKCTEKISTPDPGSRPSNGNGSGSAPANAGKSGCDTMNVDDLITQAATQYQNGFAGSALSQMTKALGCRQTVQMYRFAATYACAAHDSAAARVYFAKVPPQYQSGIEQKCQQENTPLR